MVYPSGLKAFTPLRSTVDQGALLIRRASAFRYLEDARGRTFCRDEGRDFWQIQGSLFSRSCHQVMTAVSLQSFVHAFGENVNVNGRCRALAGRLQ